MISKYGVSAESDELKPPCIIIRTAEGNKGLSLTTLLSKHTERIARNMFKRQVNEIHASVPLEEQSSFFSSISLSDPQSPSNWASRFLDDFADPALTILINNCPLIPLGYRHYVFLHKSLGEFFAAKHLFNGALTYGWVLAGRSLDLRDTHKFS